MAMPADLDSVLGDGTKKREKKYLINFLSFLFFNFFYSKSLFHFSASVSVVTGYILKSAVVSRISEDIVYMEAENDQMLNLLCPV